MFFFKFFYRLPFLMILPCFYHPVLADDDSRAIDNETAIAVSPRNVVCGIPPKYFDSQLLGLTYCTNRTDLRQLAVECFLLFTNETDKAIQIVDVNSVWSFHIEWLLPSQPISKIDGNVKTAGIEEVEIISRIICKMDLSKIKDDKRIIENEDQATSVCKRGKVIFELPARKSKVVKIIFPLRCTSICNIADVSTITYSFVCELDDVDCVYKKNNVNDLLNMKTVSKQLNMSNFCWDFATNTQDQVFLAFEREFNPDMHVDVKVDYNEYFRYKLENSKIGTYENKGTHLLNCTQRDKQ